MFNKIERYREFYEHTNENKNILFYKGILWRIYNRMAVPIGPAKLDYTIPKADTNFILRELPAASLVRFTDGLMSKKENNSWYVVICDKFIDLGQLNAKNRSEINRGLRNCKVEKVAADIIANQGYDVFISAFERYKGIKKPRIKRAEFKEKILLTKEFTDIIDYWGTFHNNKLIGYCVNYLYDNIEVNYSTVKFNPEFLRLYPSYALFYEMNKYYLKDNFFEYANDGFRSIMHQSNIQQFLIDKFGFKKAYTNLFVIYRPYLRNLIFLTKPIQNIAKYVSPQFYALHELERLRNKNVMY